MRRTPRGFTLTELLIVIAIGGILAMLGAPSFGNLLARTRAANTEVSIAGALRAARTAAVTRGARVVMCPSRDAQHCRSGDDWQHGWLVAADNDHDGQPDRGAVITAQAPLAAGTRIVTSDGRGEIAFQPTGSAGGSNVTFTVCHTGQKQGWSIVVANSGRVRTAAPDAEHVSECIAGIR